MKANLIEMEGFLRGKCLPVDMLVNETNSQYLMRKFAEAEAKCAELAVENAALKDINEWCKTDAFKNMYREFKTAESIGCPDVDCMHDAMLVAIMHAPETPATDAILAEVRAQGVDMFARHSRDLAAHYEKNGIRDGSVDRRIGIAYEAEHFAAQLRQEAAQ